MHSPGFDPLARSLAALAHPELLSACHMHLILQVCDMFASLPHLTSLSLRSRYLHLHNAALTSFSRCQYLTHITLLAHEDDWPNITGKLNGLISSHACACKHASVAHVCCLGHTSKRMRCHERRARDCCAYDPACAYVRICLCLQFTASSTYLPVYVGSH